MFLFGKHVLEQGHRCIDVDVEDPRAYVDDVVPARCGRSKEQWGDQQFARLRPVLPVVVAFATASCLQTSAQPGGDLPRVVETLTAGNRRPGYGFILVTN